MRLWKTRSSIQSRHYNPKFLSFFILIQKSIILFIISIFNIITNQTWNRQYSTGEMKEILIFYNVSLNIAVSASKMTLWLLPLAIVIEYMQVLFMTYGYVPIVTQVLKTHKSFKLQSVLIPLAAYYKQVQVFYLQSKINLNQIHAEMYCPVKNDILLKSSCELE